jgi:adenylate cyclase
MDRRPTLRLVFALSMGGLLLGLGVTYYQVVHGLEKTLLQSSELGRELASGEVVGRVTAYLNEAPGAVSDFEKQIHYGLVDPHDVTSVERGLTSLLLANENISEATLTFAMNFGTKDDIKVAPTGSGQVAVLRTTVPGDFICLYTWFDGKHYVWTSNHFSPEGHAIALPSAHGNPAPDPTQHMTFQTAIAKETNGMLTETDLHWSQIDDDLPETKRRVELSVQKLVEDVAGNFAGVIRIGLMKTQIDGAVQQHITPSGKPDPYLIFICDNGGSLITGFGDKNRVKIIGDDLRIAPEDVPPVVARALQDNALKNVDDAHQSGACSFIIDDQTYLCSFVDLPGTQGWIVGIVVPRDYYLGPILRIRSQILMTSLALIVGLFVAGGLILRSVARAQASILHEAEKMNRFDFSPSAISSWFRDVAEVLGGLEKAKTAMRAMSKYVPINLVRQLYRDGREPVLGGQTAELSVLFSDIEGFTALAETLPADRLAEILGRYLEVIARVLQTESGTIDKYIGDAVMAFWNAPEPVRSHEVRACLATLKCCAALRDLYASPEWGDVPRFRTRFGLHRCQASVGHFGASNRFNYTAIGDGINLTSRLEGLNKFYGTTIIASETIYEAVRDRFEFRLLDRVAVKGKMQGVLIYELLSEIGNEGARTTVMDHYEEAFALYQRGDFTGAVRILEALSDDPPSVALLSRCRNYAQHPPASWDGVFHFDAK